MTWRKFGWSSYNGNCAEVDEMPGGWRKSSRSGGSTECAEVADWRKSSGSVNDGACAEVASGVRVRDTKQAGDPDRTVLTFPAAAWRAFTASPDAALKQGTP